MQHLDLSFDYISALHDFEELLGPTIRSFMFYYESRSTFIYQTFICTHMSYYITTRQEIKQAL